MIVVRCQDHPTYQGKRAPRVDCADCRWIYERAGMFIGTVGVYKKVQVGGPK